MDSTPGLTTGLSSGDREEASTETIPTIVDYDLTLTSTTLVILGNSLRGLPKVDK